MNISLSGTENMIPALDILYSTTVSFLLAYTVPELDYVVLALARYIVRRHQTEIGLLISFK